MSGSAGRIISASSRPAVSANFTPMSTQISNAIVSSSDRATSGSSTAWLPTVVVYVPAVVVVMALREHRSEKETDISAHQWRRPGRACKSRGEERGAIGRCAEGDDATVSRSSRARLDRAPAGPFDPRLLHYARATRAYLILSIAVGGAAALLVIAEAWLIATIVAGAFLDHRGAASLRGPLLALLAVVSGRALLSWAAERAAFRASASAKSDLRQGAAARVAAFGPAGLDRRDTGQLTVLLTTGIDALDGYFSRYLPQVFLAVIVPVAIIGVVAGADWVSAVLIAVSVPLIPIFMALVGATTRDRTATRMRALQKLAGHFLDVVAGLPTLKVFGRAKAQARSIADVTDRYRTATMATLRLTFLSSLVLELLATVSVALVAVAVGLRLLGGNMGFHDALFVLVLAPEAYLPLRALGTHFHASADGLKAAEEIFDLIETPDGDGARGGVRADGTGIVIRGLDVTYPGRRLPAVHDFELVVQPGETVALTGPSGCGKTTVLSVVLGLRRPDAGIVRLGDVDLTEVDLDDWRRHLAWVPQRPHLFARSVAENVRLGRPDASDAHVSAALDAAGLTEAVRRLPYGVDTRLGDGGAGLSAGERQRLALARAFVRNAPLLLLDVPTGSVDNETEADVLAVIRELISGRTALIVAHRPALAALADRVVELPPAPVPSPASTGGRRSGKHVNDRPGRDAAHSRHCAARAAADHPRLAPWRRRHRRLDRAHGDVGLADLASRSAPGRGVPDAGHRRRPILRALAGVPAVRRTAGRARRGAARAVGPARPRL